jgi:16S rRNA (guanine966-N2)-methyltransferase
LDLFAGTGILSFEALSRGAKNATLIDNNLEHLKLIKKFADKFGDQNISAFNQMWSKNADPKIFQLKNIFEDPNMSAEEKAKARDKLIGTDKKQIQIFNEKYNNIKKLEQTGSL